MHSKAPSGNEPISSGGKMSENGDVSQDSPLESNSCFWTCRQSFFCVQLHADGASGSTQRNLIHLPCLCVKNHFCMVFSLWLHARFRPLSQPLKEQEAVNGTSPKCGPASAARPSRKTWKDAGELLLSEKTWVFFEAKAVQFYLYCYPPRVHRCWGESLCGKFNACWITNGPTTCLYRNDYDYNKPFFCSSAAL